MTDHRFIEESFPVKEVSEAAARDNGSGPGNIRKLHIWWARRPLPASRATAFAALTPASANIEEWQQQRNFLIQLCKGKSEPEWQVLEVARETILQSSGGHSPRVLDPFSGGGSYPLEALRLGCEVCASDYNPVAVLILKAVLEFPRQFGSPIPEPPIEMDSPAELFDNDDAHGRMINPLLSAVRSWGDKVLLEVREQIAEFYPTEMDGSTPVGYLWARTVPCQNPSCSAPIPLMRQYWLVRGEKTRIALYPETSSGALVFRIIGDGYELWPEGFDPGHGAIYKGVATCPLCGSVVDDDTIRRLFREGKAGQSMMAVILQSHNIQGKSYRLPTENDKRIFRRVASVLELKREQLMMAWGLDPVPDEPISAVRPSPNARGTSGLTRYELNKWGDLFNPRQQLVLITFIEKVRQVYALMVTEGATPEFAAAVSTYLAFGVDRLATYLSSLVRWRPDVLSFERVFDRPALEMVRDYGEVNPFCDARGSWDMEGILDVIDHLCKIPHLERQNVTVRQGTATSLPYPDGYFDAILTDPPYYDNIPYSYLSDFFYVWLKRAVGDLFPDLFSTPLTPKAGEIVAYTRPEGGFEAGKRFFEENLKLSFQEMQRVLKMGGIAVVVYAHKSTEGWETVINALLDSGLVVTSAWPLNTEMTTRVNAKETASLASSIYIVARKVARQPTGFYNEVHEELRSHLHSRLHRLWEEGIGGADFFIAAIGSAIEIFGKYEHVLDYEGNVVRADRLLQDVRTIATDYAVHQILHNGFASEISDHTRFYVLWRWNYGEARVHFDEARKLAQSCGLDLSHKWGHGSFVYKEKEFVRVLGPQMRKLEGLENSHELIDVLHRVLLFWEKSQRTELVQTLAASGYGQSEAFYRVAQAISETLPNESKEKKLLDGFLAGRERVREDVGRIAQQPRLWEE